MVVGTMGKASRNGLGGKEADVWVQASFGRDLIWVSEHGVSAWDWLRILGNGEGAFPYYYSTAPRQDLLSAGKTRERWYSATTMWCNILVRICVVP